MEALAEEIPREVRRELDPEAMDVYPLEVILLKAYPGLAAGHRWGAVSEGEDPRAEAPEDLPEVVSVAVDWVEASGISRH